MIMTIVEAIRTVLQQAPDGLTAKEIYDEIIRNNLYSFGAKNPLGVVNSQIRRRCVGLDFPTAYPVKAFIIAGHQGNKNKFALYDETLHQNEEVSSKTTKNAEEELPEERIGTALKEHIASIKQQVLDSILSNSPDFFEHLVLDLL